MANKIDKINVGGVPYEINLPTSATPSITSLTITGNLTVSGTSNLSVVNCDSLSTNKNTVIRHDSLRVNITWKGAEWDPSTVLWEIQSVSASSTVLCTFTTFSYTSYPDHILPSTLKKQWAEGETSQIVVDLNALKKVGTTLFDQPSSDPSVGDTSITSQDVYFDYILFGVEII